VRRRTKQKLRSVNQTYEAVRGAKTVLFYICVMKARKYNGDPVPAESTATRKPMDPRMIQALNEMAKFKRMARRQEEMDRRQEEEDMLGYPASYSGRIESTEDPITALLGLGPQFLKSVGKKGVQALMGAIKSGQPVKQAADDVARMARKNYPDEPLDSEALYKLFDESGVDSNVLDEWLVNATYEPGGPGYRVIKMSRDVN